MLMLQKCISRAAKGRFYLGSAWPTCSCVQYAIPAHETRSVKPFSGQLASSDRHSRLEDGNTAASSSTLQSCCSPRLESMQAPAARLCSSRVSTRPGSLRPFYTATGSFAEAGAAEETDETEDTRDLILDAALKHVKEKGWTQAALQAGAADVGLSPAAAACIPGGEAGLVQYFVSECNRRLAGELAARQAELAALRTPDRIALAVRLRLEMIAPYIDSWPQALSIQAQPGNLGTAVQQLGALSDDIWHAAGDTSTDLSWYSKRGLLAGIYTATELYMLTDYTPGYADTWDSLRRRLGDARQMGQAAGQVGAYLEGMGAAISQWLNSTASQASKAASQAAQAAQEAGQQAASMAQAAASQASQAASSAGEQAAAAAQSASDQGSEAAEAAINSAAGAMQPDTSSTSEDDEEDILVAERAAAEASTAAAGAVPAQDMTQFTLETDDSNDILVAEAAAAEASAAAQAAVAMEAPTGVAAAMVGGPHDASQRVPNPRVGGATNAQLRRAAEQHSGSPGDAEGETAAHQVGLSDQQLSDINRHT